MTDHRWTNDDLPWDKFEAIKVNPDHLKLAKAAALVEYNGHDYATYLCNVFADDPEFQDVARAWALEEVQHGAALGAWATKADPSFDFQAAVRRFRDGYRLNLHLGESIRGSRTGELIARCIVETGTSSYYTALAEATEEPVFRIMCRKIAADELRHYKLFYDHMKRYLEREGLNRFQRLKIGLGRIHESEDDELSYAYYAANAAPGDTYRRANWNAEYARRAFAYYRPHHIERMVSMVFKACGLKPHTIWQGMANRVAWWVAGSKSGKARKAA